MIRAAIVSVAVLSLGAAPLTSERIKELWKESDAERARQLKDSNEDLVKARAEIRKPIRDRNKKAVIETRKARLAEVQDRIKSLQDKNQFFPSVLPKELSVGRIGLLPSSGEIDVQQVVSQSSVLANLLFMVNVPDSRLPSHDRTVVKEVPVLIRTPNAARMADGTRTNTAGVFEVTGTEQYTTVLGAPRTVFVLEHFDVERLKR
jgi:gas vesicle protein